MLVSRGNPFGAMTLPSNEPQRRPFWVWVISLFYLLTGTLALMTLGRFLGMDAVGDRAADVLTVKKQALTWSIYGVLPAASVAGGALLLMLHRWAFYAFLLALLLNIVNILRYVMVTGGSFQFISGSSAVGVLVGLGVIVTVCVYTYRLKMRNVLK